MPYSNVLSALARLAATRCNDEAFREAGGDSVSYGALNDAVAALSRSYRSLPDTVGILAPSGIAWVQAQLALTAADKNIVPLPVFFSHDQLLHIIKDAGIGHILATPETVGTAGGFGVPHSEITVPDTGDALPAGSIRGTGKARLIIYTSGSTGRPKGVCIADRQLAASVKAIGDAVAAGPDDLYLSVLPMSLLLEQICAIYLPLLAGIRVVFCPFTSGTALVEQVERVRPTLMVLVPQLLSAWIAAAKISGRKAPDSLRVVATGGAPVSETLAAAAWNLGIPVHEGYGLSECCSVVALNRPGDRVAGTVGRPLDGLDVSLDDGEIVVRGPTVMEGYLNDSAPPPEGIWRTGDLGGFDDQGRLSVYGRKDNILVTPAGRNVVPEWIEAMVTTDPRIALCILIITPMSGLTAILVPLDAYTREFQSMSPADVASQVAGLVAEAPRYARPAHCLVVPDAEMQRHGLLTGNGRPRRDAILKAFSWLWQDFVTPLPFPAPEDRHVVL